METTGDDDDEPAEKYWRAQDFVAKASMAHWPDCLGAGGKLDKQAEAEATEKALDNLLAHGVVEDMKREDATKFISLRTRLEKG